MLNENFNCGRRTRNIQFPAELFFTVILILGGISLITMILEIRKIKFASYGFILAILFSLAAGVLAKNVGTTGGEIKAYRN